MAGKNQSSHKDCTHEATKTARAKCRRWRDLMRSVVSGESKSTS